MRTVLLDIARSGVLAPSADNNHVFTLEFSDTSILLWPSHEFITNADSLRRVLGLISLGAVVENMRLRAGELGFSASIHWYAVQKDTAVAKIDFSPDHAGISDDLASAIAARHTNRSMYSRKGLTDFQISQLSLAGLVDGVRLIWLTGEARRQALGMIWRAESERFLRRTLHHDLFSSIRFDLPWHKTSVQSIPPGALGIETPMRPLFKALRFWPVMRAFTWVGGHRIVGLRAGLLPCWQAPALGLLATSLPIEQGSLASGKALERLWLRATLLDLALQPMAASAVLPLQSMEDNGASEALRAFLLAGWQAIAPGLTPMLIFRMGSATQPLIRASRKDVKDYIQAI